eukprot:6193074-Pleurochrysis_carterae.AAC.4
MRPRSSALRRRAFPPSESPSTHRSMWAGSQAAPHRASRTRRGPSPPRQRAVVFCDGARYIPTPPSGHAYSTSGGRPSLPRGVRGVTPSSSRKSGHDAAAKPSACSSSCVTVASCSALSVALSETRLGHTLTKPSTGLSYWSRWHVSAYARTAPAVLRQKSLAFALTSTATSASAPSPSGYKTHSEPVPVQLVPTQAVHTRCCESRLSTTTICATSPGIPQRVSIASLHTPLAQ